MRFSLTGQEVFRHHQLQIGIDHQCVVISCLRHVSLTILFHRTESGKYSLGYKSTLKLMRSGKGEAVAAITSAFLIWGS